MISTHIYAINAIALSSLATGILDVFEDNITILIPNRLNFTKFTVPVVAATVAAVPACAQTHVPSDIEPPVPVGPPEPALVPPVEHVYSLPESFVTC